MVSLFLWSVFFCMTANTLDVVVASTIRKGMNRDTASSGNKGKVLQVCTCGWRKEGSLKGLRIHKAKEEMHG